MSQQEAHKQLITPYLTIYDGAEKALEWYMNAFNAKVLDKHYEPKSKKLLHAEMQLPNGGIIFLADHFPEFDKNEVKDKSENSSICSHVQFKHGEADAFWKHLTDSHGKDIKIFMDYDFQFWNDKYANFNDPFGHRWSIGQPMTPEEIANYDNPMTNNNKKRSFEEAELDEDNNNNNHNNKKLKLSSGFIEIKKIDHEIGLGITYKVGSNGSHTFASACQDGYPKLKQMCCNHKLEPVITKHIAICPDDPAIHNPARYTVATLVDSHKIKKEDLKQYETDEIKIVEIPSHDYYIYQHVGEYQGLPQSWKNCITEVKEKGYVISNGNCYEHYIDDCCKVKMDQCRTIIYVPIHKKH